LGRQQTSNLGRRGLAGNMFGEHVRKVHISASS
jgi:hypothetical protein